MILAQFNLSVKKFNLLHNLSSEDMILLMEILPINHSKTIITKFLAQILEYKDEKAVLKWLSNNRLLESQIFNINLFAALLREINLSLKKVIAQKGTKNIGLLDEYFDENNNIDPEKILMLPNTINSILIKSKKFSKKFHNNSKEKNDLYIILEVFKVLPLMNMSKDFNKLGLAFAVELAVLCSRNETLALISLEKLFDFFSYDIDLNACFNTGLLIKWLSELSFESNQANKFKVKIIERLVNICSKTQNGISEIELMIESHQLYEESTTAKALETQVIIYDELGKVIKHALAMAFSFFSYSISRGFLLETKTILFAVFSAREEKKIRK